jgi:hypothetical protein
MPTSLPRLKQAIIDAKEAMEQTNADAAWERYADRLATAIINEIKQATITYNGGLANGGGVVGGVFNHTTT